MTREPRVVIDTNVLTGDRALLATRTFRSVAIVSPSGYLRIARGQS